jgi:hypothetical protein
MLSINADDHPLFMHMHRPDPKRPPHMQDKRVVVILPPAQYEPWLDATPQESFEFMRQYPAELLTMTPEPLAPKETKAAEPGRGDPARSADAPVAHRPTGPAPTGPRSSSSPEDKRLVTRQIYCRYFLGIGCVRQSNGPSAPLPRMRVSKNSRFELAL